MAITKIWKVKDRLDFTINYAVNRRKDRTKVVCIRYKLYALYCSARNEK